MNIDALGENIMNTGTVKQIDGAMTVQNANGVFRSVGGKRRYYVAAYKKNFGIHAIDWLDSVDSQVPAGFGGTVIQTSGIVVYDTKAFQQGAKSIVLIPVEL